MKTKLLPINVTFEQDSGYWRYDLHSEDGTCWTIERHQNETYILERCREFAQFSGLPMTYLGNPMEIES